MSQQQAHQRDAVPGHGVNKRGIAKLVGLVCIGSGGQEHLSDDNFTW